MVVLYLLVSIRFQVLFHSPPGVLFTFPSQYYTLSVTRSYLALGDGPPVFPQDSSCPVVLRIPTASTQFRLRGYHPLWPTFPCNSTIEYLALLGPYPCLYHYKQVWALSLSLATTQEIVVYFLFLRVLRCFSSPGSPRYTMNSYNVLYPAVEGFPHSDICGSMFICNSPQLFAACHVLLRRLVPRHPPYALSSLIAFRRLCPISDHKFSFLSS